MCVDVSVYNSEFSICAVSVLSLYYFLILSTNSIILKLMIHLSFCYSFTQVLSLSSLLFSSLLSSKQDISNMIPFLINLLTSTHCLPYTVPAFRVLPCISPQHFCIQPNGHSVCWAINIPEMICSDSETIRQNDERWTLNEIFFGVNRNVAQQEIPHK